MSSLFCSQKNIVNVFLNCIVNSILWLNGRKVYYGKCLECFFLQMDGCGSLSVFGGQKLAGWIQQTGAVAHKPVVVLSNDHTSIQTDLSDICGYFHMWR